LASCLHFATLTAQPGQNDPTFNAWTGSGLGTSPAGGPIDVVLRQPDGRVILAGEFVDYNGQPARHIVRITADGLRDASFNIGTGPDYPIWAMVLQPDGKIILGGEFNTFNGSAASKLIRLNANGSVDPTFTVQPLEVGISALALQADGRLIAAGVASDVGDDEGNAWVARFEEDGDLDPTFNVSSVTDGHARALALSTDGSVWVGGNFSGFNGSGYNNLVRLDANGNLDPTFAIGSGFDGGVYTLLQQPDGAVLVGGSFTSIDVLPRNGLVRLLEGGSLDPSFDPGEGFTDTGGPGAVFSLALQPDGQILVGGQFNAYDAMLRGDIALLNTDGSLDTSFDPVFGPDGYIIALCALPNDQVLIAGSFQFYQGARLGNVARLNANATLDATFNPAPGFNGEVLALVVLSNGKTIVGGSFTEVNGVVRNRIARLNANGTLDATFDPGSGFNDDVLALALQPDGRVIVGGDFSSFNGTGRNGIARLTSGGALDATFNPGSGFRQESDPGWVQCLALQPDGKVLVGGSFNAFNGAFANKIVRLRTNGALDGTFNAGTGFAGGIYALALAPDGKVYIGGSIDHNDLNEQCPGHVARLNSNGTLDSGFTYELFLFDSDVRALALQADGDLIIVADDRVSRFANGQAYVFGPGGGRSMAVRPDDKVVVGGRFPDLSGSPIHCIARLNAEGGVDPSFTPLQGFAGGELSIPVVNAVGLLPDGRVMVGGEFTSFDEVLRNRLTRLLDSNCVIGSPCDDGDPNTTNTVLQADCTCGGGSACTEDLDLLITTDAGVDEITWEIVQQGTTIVVATGGPLAANAQLTADICLSAGCYELRVMDAAGDGMSSGSLGGYVLQDENGARIIDNTANGFFGSLSTIANNGGFCVPMGTDRVIHSSCDKLDWVDGNYIVAAPDPAVSAQFGLTNSTSGYEFWFFDPNGSYSFRRFRNHASSDGFAPNNATRACHAKINNWAAANRIPAQVLMNVRVRGRVAGVNNEWGPACRFKIDPVQAACPLTKLMDIPGNAFLSCGATRAWGSGNYVHARPVSGATQYQFRFRLDAEGFLAVRSSSTYFVQLNWLSDPLQNGKTYQVEVRAFKNGAWCVDNGNLTGTAPFVPWGEVCALTIDNTPANSGNQNFAAEGADGELRMFPNPNRGDVLNFSLSAIEEGVNTVSLDIYELTGKRMSARTIAVTNRHVNTILDLNGELAAGMYVVNITAGDKSYTERLVIQP
jgi:uncharacterized delta-60 repeat protein